MGVLLEIEFREGEERPKGCTCPESGLSADCPHHGRALSSWGWNEDGEIIRLESE